MHSVKYPNIWTVYQMRYNNKTFGYEEDVHLTGKFLMFNNAYICKYVIKFRLYFHNLVFDVIAPMHINFG